MFLVADAARLSEGLPSPVHASYLYMRSCCREEKSPSSSVGARSYYGMQPCYANQY
jgi:hypothetical protein